MAGVRGIIAFLMPIPRSGEGVVEERGRVHVLIDVSMTAGVADRLHAMPRAHVSIVENPEAHQRALPAELIRNVEFSSVRTLPRISEI